MTEESDNNGKNTPPEHSANQNAPDPHSHIDIAIESQREGLLSLLSEKHVLADIKQHPELEHCLQWRGLRKLGQKHHWQLSGEQPESHHTSVSELYNALKTYALTNVFPPLSPELESTFEQLDTQMRQIKSGGSLDDFLQHFFSSRTPWQEQKNLFAQFIAPLIAEASAHDAQTGTTEEFTYKPPQASTLSEDKEPIAEDAIQTKVGPAFLGGYFRRRRCRFDPRVSGGIARPALQKQAWYPAEPDMTAAILDTKRPYTGIYNPGQENMLPWNKDSLPLLSSLEPANTFVLMRDEQGSISIEPKQSVELSKSTPFTFDTVLHRCNDNRLTDAPLPADTQPQGGALDDDMQSYLDYLATQNHLSSASKGRLIAAYIRKHFRYPNDEQEIGQIDSVYQQQMDRSVQGLWHLMSQTGILHCYWANILRDELCKRLTVASQIVEGPYVQKDPRFDYAIVEAPGLTEHAWGIVWDDQAHEWTHDGQDATPPKERDEDDEGEPGESEPQDGDFGPTDPPEQLQPEELEKLYQELEQAMQQNQEPDEPTPQQRAAEQFEREKGVKKVDWEAFERKMEQWGKVPVPAQASIDGHSSTIREEDKKLTELIKKRRKLPKKHFTGPVEESVGDELDNPVMAYLDSISGSDDPMGYKVDQVRIREQLEPTIFEQDFIADLSGSMDSSGAVHTQQQLIMLALYYDWQRQQHLQHSSVRQEMTTRLDWRSQVLSFGGFTKQNLGTSDELNEKQLLQLDGELSDADGSSSAGLYQNLVAYRDSITDEDKQLLKGGHKVKMLTVSTDGDIPDQANCKAVITELRALGVVVQGIGFGSGASNIMTVCDGGEPHDAAVLNDITQAAQARAFKLKRVIEEQL